MDKYHIGEPFKDLPAAIKWIQGGNSVQMYGLVIGPEDALNLTLHRVARAVDSENIYPIKISRAAHDSAGAAS